MQRYMIALGRGFKGNFNKFLKENRTKEKFPEGSQSRNGNKRIANLETHVIACLETERHVAD